MSRKLLGKVKAVYLVLMLTTILLCRIVLPAMATLPEINPSLQGSTSVFAQTTDLIQQGKALYEAGQFAQAAEVLRQAAQNYQSQGNTLKHAAALTDLALTYQQLGSWTEAQKAVEKSLQILETSSSRDRLTILAQTLNIQGDLQLNLGQAELALASWQRAEATYQQLKDQAGIVHSRINQTQALQVLGFYRRAQLLLTDLTQTLQGQTDSLTYAIVLRSRGDVLQLTGDSDQAQKVLRQSLAIAQRLQSPQDISAALFSLGNTTSSQSDVQSALTFYQQAAAMAPTAMGKVQAQINQFSLLVKTDQHSTAASMIPSIQAQLAHMGSGQAEIYARIHFAQSLMQLETRKRDTGTVAQLLAATVQQARALGDKHAESHALGTLGELYEQAGQPLNAQELTRQALALAQTLNASDIAYRWHWQMGRLLKQQGQIKDAIIEYDAAVSELQSLRSDLVAIGRNIQFSFKESVEPVYRESVQLLLQSQPISEQSLDKARQRMELLQLAELDNFFREACLNTQTVLIDKVVDQDNPTTAIVYPILLPNELQVIIKIPRQPLRHYAVQKSQTEVEQVLGNLRQNLAEPDTTEEVKALSQEVYNWLIRPIESDLQQKGVKTLVFVLDGALRSVPMSVLYDGKQYLVEKYAVALSLGLQLIQPKPLAQEQLKVLAAGLVQPPPNFSQFPPLPEIKSEMGFIAEAGISTQQLLDQRFTGKALKTAVNSMPFNVVHLATHGQFSSQASETFILAADGPINVLQLDALLRDREQTRTTGAIELLVLSACETAAGDNRAALGLAGMAVRAGARSTLASLWQLDDRATAIFVKEFYRALAKEKVTKAEALRQAQLTLLRQYPNYDRPGFWAPYVLVGNWL
jgi:CHAT domain-containing protein